MNGNHIAIAGRVGSDPDQRVSEHSRAYVSFRFVSTERRWDSEQKGFVDGDESWVTVKAFGRLAENAGFSLKKGDKAIVMGRLHAREWSTEERRGVAIEVIADAIGHDFTFGKGTFTRGGRPLDTADPATGETPEPDANVTPIADSLGAGEPIPNGWPVSQPESEPQPAKAS